MMRFLVMQSSTTRFAIGALIAIAIGLSAGAYGAFALPKNPQKDSGSLDVHEVLESEDSDIRERTNEPFSVTDRFMNEVFRDRAAQYQAEIPLEVTRQFYKMLGAERMLTILEEDPYCHSKSHTVGRVMYEETQDMNLSLQIAGNRCANGAFHGVLMGVYNEIQQGSDYFDLKKVADFSVGLCKKSEIRSNFGKGSCLHGVGHALLFIAEGDIPVALQMCNAFLSIGGKYYCATGVYMQREHDNGKEDAKVSATFPCDTYDHPAACYRYKIRRVFSKTEIASATALCSSMPHGSDRQGCFHGIGFGFYRVFEDAPELLKTACTSDDARDTRMCIEGFSGIMSVYYSPDGMRDMCAKQPEPMNSWCVDGARVSNFGMKRDFERYFAPRK